MSCLVEKFKYYIDLNPEEESLLTTLEKDVRHYEKNDIVYEQNGHVENIYVVKSGWLITYNYLNDGGRMIMNIYSAGDVLGFSTLPFEDQHSGLMAITPCKLCPFPRDGVSAVVCKSKKLTALLFSMAIQDNVVLLDRLKAVGRMAGENRIAMLLLQIWARLKVTCSSVDTTFPLPMSQEMIGDALGITPVYVNRMMKQMQEDGWITYGKREVTLLKPQQLAERCDFKDRYYKINVDWYSV